MRAFHITAALAALLPYATCADIPAPESRYAKDREQAIHAFSADLRDRCIDDFSRKWQKHFTPMGEAVFNDSVSRQVYKTVFWKRSDRGVAFTLPVKAEDGKGAFIGDIACFYAVDDKALHFQLSQQVYRRF